MYEKIKELCKLKNISVNKLEQELGFAKGSLCRIDVNKPSIDKLQKIAKYFDVGIEYLTGEENEEKGYYINPETAETAQKIFESKELKMLFDVQSDMAPEDLMAMYNVALALKRKERGNFEDGC